MDKPKQYKVIISEKFCNLMAKQIYFLAQQDIKRSKKFKNELIEAIHSLQTFPERHPFFNEEYIPPNKYHKMFVPNWSIILYQIKDDNVYVEYIINCRQNYQWLINNL